MDMEEHGDHGVQPGEDGQEELNTEQQEGKVKKSRSRTGCLPCRNTRVKCGEQRPACQRCSERSIPCIYPTPTSQPRRQAQPRPIKSCEACRRRKAKCNGIPGSTCEGCQSRRVPCEWIDTTIRQNRSYTRSSSPRPSSIPFLLNNTMPEVSSGDLFPVPAVSTSQANPFVFPPPRDSIMLPRPAVLPTSTTGTFSNPSMYSNISEPEIRSLLRLYFSTAHQFGLLCFIHEPDFWERYDQGKIPPSLALIMAASALRFGGRAITPEMMTQADDWAKEAGDRLLANVFNEFGATELMELVLCHHYDFQAGRYSRGWMMAGMAVRMMTFLRLNMLDETPHPSTKPFLSVETLRRLAWSVWYLDATIDGGNFGFTTIGEGAMTIQLPSDERSFLLHQSIITQPLVPPPPDSLSAYPTNLGLAAHLIRAMHARQILADATSRIQRRLIPPQAIGEFVNQAISQSTHILDALPRDLEYNRSLYYAYKDQLPLLVHLYVMRNTATRHIARLKMLAAEHLQDGLTDIARQRRELIDQSIALASIFSDAIEHDVIMDPQMAMHAYNAIEVLLFQPLRQQADHTLVSVSRDEVAACLKPLMCTIRTLATRSELVSLLHPEPVNRMVRMNYTDDLTNEDILAVLKKVHCLEQSDKEFDFNESFWRYELSLKQSSADPTAQSPNDRLLEVQSEPSPSQPPALTPRLPIIERTGDPSNEDPLARLQSFLATNSRRNSFSLPQVGEGENSGNGMNGTGMSQKDLERMFDLPSTDETIFPFPWLISG